MKTKEIIFNLILTGILSAVFFNLFTWGKPFDFTFTFLAIGVGMVARGLLIIIFSNKTPKHDNQPIPLTKEKYK